MNNRMCRWKQIWDSSGSADVFCFVFIYFLSFLFSPTRQCGQLFWQHPSAESSGQTAFNLIMCLFIVCWKKAFEVKFSNEERVLLLVETFVFQDIGVVSQRSFLRLYKARQCAWRRREFAWTRRFCFCFWDNCWTSQSMQTASTRRGQCGDSGDDSLERGKAWNQKKC